VICLQQNLALLQIGSVSSKMQRARQNAVKARQRGGHASPGRGFFLYRESPCESPTESSARRCCAVRALHLIIPGGSIMTKTAFLLALIASALTSMQRASLLGIIALGLPWTGGAQAQIFPARADIFLQWPGIVGTSTQRGYQGQIELLSYSQSGSNNNGGPPVCGAVTIRKIIDETSTNFFSLMFSGTTTTQSVYVRLTKADETTFYTVRLENVRVVSITQNDSHFTNAPELVVETIVLSATQFIFASAGKTFGWDCSANRKL
jgi:type VI protein secretion system component Hcp